MISPSSPPTPAIHCHLPAPPGSERVPTLDLLRGSLVLVSMVALLVVPAIPEWPDNPLSAIVADQLTPSAWDGCTPGDVLMPAFLLVTGASAFLSIERRRRSGQSATRILTHLARRCAVLFAIGLLLDSGLPCAWEEMRWLGPFQRIALCHTAVGALCLVATWKVLAVLAATLLGNYAVAFEMDPAGEATASADTARDAERDPYSAEHNVAAQFDRAFLPGMKYFGTWDPDGLLTTVPALALTMLGAIAAQCLPLLPHAGSSGRGWMALIGAVGLINAGLLLDPWQPINAWLLTLPFVLIASGSVLLALVALSAWERRAAWPTGLSFVRQCGRQSLLVMISLHLIQRFVPVSISSFASLIWDGPIYSHTLAAGFGMIALCWPIFILSRRD